MLCDLPEEKGNETKNENAFKRFQNSFERVLVFYLLPLFIRKATFVDILQFSIYEISELSYSSLDFWKFRRNERLPVSVKKMETNETQMSHFDACHDDIELEFAPASGSSSVYNVSDPSYSKFGPFPDQQAFALDETILDPDGTLHHSKPEFWRERRPPISPTKLEVEAMERDERRRAQRNKNQLPPDDVFETACDEDGPDLDEDGPDLDADEPDLDEDDQEVSPRLRRAVRYPWQPSRARRRRFGRCHSSDAALDADWVASLREHAARASTKQEETAPRRRMAPAEERRSGVCAKLDETAAVRTKARVFQKRL